MKLGTAADFDADFVEVYDFQITEMNVYKGGPFQQAVSGLSNLNNQWYDGNAYQVYAFEYTPGGSGDITWFVGQDATWRMTGDALGPNGNVDQRIIPEEPMSMVLNFGMSTGFSRLNLTGLAPLMPATMRFDYIRVYQDPNSELVTCDPPGWETTAYINDHYDVYTNPNVTRWYVSHSLSMGVGDFANTDDRENTAYKWPLNQLVNGC
jgi:beta-glucan synthesis-associated protein KRE6